MKTRLTALLMVLMMVLCSVAVAESPVNPKGVFPIVDEPITLTVWCNLPAQRAENIENNDATRYLEEKTGIHINWRKVGTNEAAEQLRVMMAAATDLPDVIMTANTGAIITNEQVNMYGMQGLLLPLNDLIEKYGDAWYTQMDMVPWARNQVKAPDGNIYGLGGVSNGAYHMTLYQKFYVNQKWLDKLGLEKPTTIDEFHDMLVAFRDGDPNGNGIKDEVPLSGSIGKEYIRTTLDCFLMNAFQYSTSWEKNWLYLEDDKVACGALTEGYREGLRWFKQLYDEGLMDHEIFINTQESLKLLSGAADGNKLGCFTAMFPVAGLATDNPEIYDYVALSPLEGPNGRCSPDNPQGRASVTGYLITRDCKYPEAAFRMGDFLMTLASSDDGKCDNMMMLYGEEGVGWEYPTHGELGLNGEPARFVLLPGKLQENGEYSRNDICWDEIGPWTKPMNERNSQGMNPAAGYNIEQVLYDDTRDAYEPFRVKKSLPTLIFSAEDAEIMADYVVNTQNYGQEAIAAFVTGQWSLDDDWDTYVQTMNDYGMQELIDIYERAYEEYKAGL